MTKKQIAAAASLTKALNRCHTSGLKGGVYSGNFCLWPKAGVDPMDDPRENSYYEVKGHDFFGLVKKHGAILDDVRMSLDGGAGV